MSSGGYRPNSGPSPDPDALRRDRPSDRVKYLTLPAKREGKPPVFPFRDPTDRESVLWAGLWTRPQAVVWESHHLELEVALYVRCLADAEKPGGSVPMRTLVMRLQDSLGLSLNGMKALRWLMPSPEPVRAPTQLLRDQRGTRTRLRDLQGGSSPA